MQEPSAVFVPLPANKGAARARRPGALPLVAVLACAFLLSGATLARAQVHDNASIFSKAAIEQAEQTMKELKDKHRHELLVETYPKVPDAMQADFQNKEKAQFFEDWANERFKAGGIDGVVVLICMDPRHLQIVMGNETQKKLFTSADRTDLTKHLAEVLGKKQYDDALTRTANFVLKRFDEHDPRYTGATNSAVGTGTNTPSSGTPAYTPPASYSQPGSSYSSTPRSTNCGTGGIQTFVCLFVGAIILIALLRLVFRNSGGGYGGGYGGGGYGGGYQGGPPPPQGGYGGFGGGYPGGYGPGYAPQSRGSGFGSGLLGGLLGGAVGGYAADRLMHQNEGGTSVPQSGGGYSPPPPADSGGTFTPDTSSSGGGADFGPSSDSGGSSGSDFGSSDSGGGADFGGGGGGGDGGSSGGSDF